MKILSNYRKLFLMSGLSLALPIALGTLVFTSACTPPKSGGGGGTTQIATPPVNSNICSNQPGAPGSSCSSDIYSNYPNQFHGYRHDVQRNHGNYNNGFCGCEQNYLPVYQSQWGLSCMNSTYYNSNSQNNYVIYGYGNNGGYDDTQGGSNGWAMLPQLAPYGGSNQGLPGQGYSPQGINNGQGSCYNGTILACDPSVISSCGNSSQICVALGGSRIGTCQFQNGYSYQYYYPNSTYFSHGFSYRRFTTHRR